MLPKHAALEKKNDDNYSADRTGIITCIGKVPPMETHSQRWIKRGVAVAEPLNGLMMMTMMMLQLLMSNQSRAPFVYLGRRFSPGPQ